MENNTKNETILESLAQNDKLFREAKNKIASLASALIENPEEHIGKLRELRNILLDNSYFKIVRVRSLVIISFAEIFRDILPSYKIRLATDKERVQQTKKDLLKLRKYEETLLIGYKKYLDILSAMCKGVGRKKSTKRKENPFTRIPWRENEKEVAVRCASSLYMSHPSFNYSDDLVTMMVPFLKSDEDQLSRLVATALEQSMIEDKNGDTSLRVCRLVHEHAKGQQYNIPAALIRIFLVLNIKEIQVDEAASTLTHKEKMKKWSRKQRKVDKVTARFNRDMEETKATTTRDSRLQLNTHILREIFHVYFKVLKTRRAAHLLSAVLEGLSKFAHLVDLRFFDDLFQVLNEIIDKPEISLVDGLHCVHTAVTILTGQAASIDIDPGRFYNHLYRLLPHTSSASPNVIDLIVHCLDALLVRRRRQVSINQVLAFVKRLTTAALHQSSENACVLLAAILRYLRLFPRCEVLFDPEAEVGGSYLPNLDDPFLCNPSSAVLWEMTIMCQDSCPLVARLASQIFRVYAGSAIISVRDDFARMSTSQVRDTVAAACKESLSEDTKPLLKQAKDLKGSRKRSKLSKIYLWGLEEAKRVKLDLSVSPLALDDCTVNSVV